MLRKGHYFIVIIAKKKDIGLKNIGVTDEESCFRVKCRPKYESILLKIVQLI